MLRVASRGLCQAGGFSGDLILAKLTADDVEDTGRDLGIC